MWIGYADDGLGWLKDERFFHFGAATGFPESNLSQVIPDAHGWVWFAGDHGIFKARQDALEAAAQGQPANLQFVRYGRSDGLLSMEANFGATPGATRGRDGRLWLPMGTALAVIDPSRRPDDPRPPTTLIERVEVDGQTRAAYRGILPVRAAVNLHAPGAALELPPNHFRLAFVFTAPDFSAPENVHFRYRLEGYDADWVAAGAERAASYSRLAAGNYRFRVQACNSDGVWNEAGASLGFVVRPFLWQNWWFRAAALGLFTALTAATVRRWVLRRIGRRLKALEQLALLGRERARIARDLHDEFGSRLTELGLIAELELKDALGASNRASRELVDGLRALERDLDMIIWAVNPQNDSLNQLVSFICRATEEFLRRSEIVCRFDLPDRIPACALNPESRHHLFLVVREAVSNVVKHSMATAVKVAFFLEADGLHFRLEDNGCGFAVPPDGASDRNGLRNMRSRIEELRGTFAVRSERGRGTVVEFTFPLAPGGCAP